MSGLSCMKDNIWHSAGWHLPDWSILFLKSATLIKSHILSQLKYVCVCFCGLCNDAMTHVLWVSYSQHLQQEVWEQCSAAFSLIPFSRVLSFLHFHSLSLSRSSQFLWSQPIKRCVTVWLEKQNTAIYYTHRGWSETWEGARHLYIKSHLIKGAVSHICTQIKYEVYVWLSWSYMYIENREGKKPRGAQRFTPLTATMH